MASKCKIMNINKILGERSPVPPSFMISVRDCSPDHAVDLVVEVGDGGEGHDAQHHEPEQGYGPWLPWLQRVNVLLLDQRQEQL